MKDAITARKRITRSKQRDRRRPSTKLDKLMKHFGAIRARRAPSHAYGSLAAAVPARPPLVQPSSGPDLLIGRRATGRDRARSHPE
jgi:hypothetical protein